MNDNEFMTDKGQMPCLGYSGAYLFCIRDELCFQIYPFKQGIVSKLNP